MKYSKYFLVAIVSIFFFIVAQYSYYIKDNISYYLTKSKYYDISRIKWLLVSEDPSYLFLKKISINKPLYMKISDTAILSKLPKTKEISIDNNKQLYHLVNSKQTNNIIIGYYKVKQKSLVIKNSSSYYIEVNLKTKESLECFGQLDDIKYCIDDYYKINRVN